MDRLDPQELQREFYFYSALIEDYEKNQKELVKLLQEKSSVKPQSQSVANKSFNTYNSNNFNHNSQSSVLNNSSTSFFNKINKPSSVQNTSACSIISNINKQRQKPNFVTTHNRTVINRPNTSITFSPNVKPNIHSTALNISKRTVLVRNNLNVKVPKKAHSYMHTLPNRTVLFTGASGSSRNSSLILNSFNTSKQIIAKHIVDKKQTNSLKGESSTVRTVVRPCSELKKSDRTVMKKLENRSQIMNEILALTLQLKQKTSNLKNTKGLSQISSSNSNHYKKASSSSSNINFIPLKQNHHESVKGEKASTLSNSYASFHESLQKLNSKPSVCLASQDKSVFSTASHSIDTFTQKIEPRQITSKLVQNVSENISITRMNQLKKKLPIQHSQQKSSNSTSSQVTKSPKTNIKPESVSQNKLSSKKKVLSSKYKVINKNVSVSLGNKDGTPRKEKMKADFFSPVIHNCALQRHSVSKSKKKLNSKYKIINRTPRNVLQKSFIKLDLRDNDKKHIAKYCSYKLVSKSNKSVENLLKHNIVQSPSFIKKGKRIKSIHKIINVSPTMKVKSKLPASVMKRSVKKSCVLKSKYKVVNKSLLSPANMFAKKLRFQGSSNGNSWSSWEGISPIFGRQNTPKNHVLVKRLYKSKRTIINKNSSPISQTARMIKTKYLSLNKRQPLSFHQRVKSSTPVIFKSYSSGRNYHAKNRSFRPRNQTAFYHSTLRSSNALKFRHSQYRSVNRYAKVNNKGKRKHVFISTTFNRSKKHRNSPRRSFSKISSPVTQTLASRVLHRSIHRASKKETKKVNRYCMFYNRFGRCNRGVQCTFIHDPSKIAVCTRFLRGTCRMERCPFSHEVCPGKMALCSFFLLGTCSRGDACPYTHRVLSPDAQLCRAFVQGHCPRGRKCQKAHILICPQYVAGICEKGDSCVFPHPPQKPKKDLPQESKKSVDKQEIEELMEDVSRYFQTFTEGSKESDGIKLVVPRTRALPEQPSFIPLSGLAQESQ